MAGKPSLHEFDCSRLDTSSIAFGSPKYFSLLTTNHKKVQPQAFCLLSLRDANFLIVALPRSLPSHTQTQLYLLCCTPVLPPKDHLVFVTALCLPRTYFAGAFSFRAASCRSSVSTYSGGIWIYLTTLPLTKQFCKATSCGYFSGLTIFTLSSLTFKYWSTLWSVPVRTTSFFSSTAISLPTRVLKKEKKIYQRGQWKTWTENLVRRYLWSESNADLQLKGLLNRKKRKWDNTTSPNSHHSASLWFLRLLPMMFISSSKRFQTTSFSLGEIGDRRADVTFWDGWSMFSFAEWIAWDQRRVCGSDTATKKTQKIKNVYSFSIH